MAWMTAHLLKPYDADGVITPQSLLGKPSGSAADVEGLLELPAANPDAAYDLVMKKQAERHG